MKMQKWFKMSFLLIIVMLFMGTSPVLAGPPVLPTPGKPVPVQDSLDSLDPALPDAAQDETALTALSPIEGRIYEPRGIGGGGGMSGFSISPYSDLWFVGTDMGTLFRSYNAGVSWQAISHLQTTFHADLPHAAYLGFAKDDLAIFHAPQGLNPVRSLDTGVTWSAISIPLASDEHIKYWLGNSTDANNILCATDQGLLQTTDMGVTWQRLSDISGFARGTVFDYSQTPAIIYHATETAIYKSTDGGATFTRFHQPAVTPIRAFTGGRDAAGLTLAFIDSDGEHAASAWATANTQMSDDERQQLYDHSGYVWVMPAGQTTFQTVSQYGGAFIRMAENNSSTIYVVGDDAWPRQYGTKVWVSEDTGNTWELRFHQYNWDTNDAPYEPWPADKLDYSAVGLGVGWDDDGYEAFSVNRRNAAIAGGSGWYFLHTTADSGAHWQSPFTEFVDTPPRESWKYWRSTGLEMTSAYGIEFHPNNPQVGYAGFADIHGLATEDGGKTFRITSADGYNSIYDYAFDPADDQVAFAAVNGHHDWPTEWYAMVLELDGGIYRTDDRGYTWTELTDSIDCFGMLSVAYDADRNILYGGSHRVGVIRSTDGGATWEYFNDGLPNIGNTPYNGTSLPDLPGRIIGQIEIDPNNGNVYILLSGDYSYDATTGNDTITNQDYTGIYFLDVEHGSTTWQLLRGAVHYPSGADSGYTLWWYPTAFAIDFDNPSTLWMVDKEMMGSWLTTGAWKSTDGGENWYRKLTTRYTIDVRLDPQNPDYVYVSALNEGGYGGPYYSTDGGSSWQRNLYLPEQNNIYSVTFDPENPNKMFYNYFGGGFFYGPRAHLLDAPVVTISAPTKISDVSITDTTINVKDSHGILASNVTVDASSTATTSNLACTQVSSVEVNCTISIDSSGDLVIAAVDDAANSITETEKMYTIASVALHVAPTDGALHITWGVTGSVLAPATWEISYTGPPGVPPSPIVGIPAIDRGYTLTGLTNGASYDITLKAVLNGKTILSATQTATPTATPTYLPLVTISKISTNDLRLSWEHPEDYRLYRVWRSTAPYFAIGGPGEGEITAAPWQFDDAGALTDPAENHYYRVVGIRTDDGSTISKRVGEFDFALIAGD